MDKFTGLASANTRSDNPPGCPVEQKLADAVCSV
jgi:hypothetical protein